MSGPTLSGDRTWIELQAVRHERNALRRERDALLGKPIRLDEREHAGDPAVAWRAYHQAQERAEKAEASAAAMRWAIEAALRYGWPDGKWRGEVNMKGVVSVFADLRDALSSDAGRALSEEVERLRATVDDLLPICCFCSRPATCFGSYESRANWGFACDGCCGHGREDGHCFRDWSSIGATLNSEIKQSDALDAENERLRARVAELEGKGR
jgi:hypothetical protein